MKRNNSYLKPHFGIDLYSLCNLICHAKGQVIAYAKDRQYWLEYEVSCVRDEVTLYGKLKEYIKILENLKESILLDYKFCLDNFKIQRILEAVRTLLPSNCDNEPCDLQWVEDLDSDMWIVAHPYCAGYQEWEWLNHVVCEDISLSVDITQKICDTSLVFSVESIDCTTNLEMTIEKQKVCETSLLLTVEPQLCEIIPYMHIYQKNCDTQLKVTVSKKDCELEFKALVEKVKCDLSFKQYVTLIDCNLSPTFIAKVYECGLKFNVSVQKKECAIQLKNHVLKLGTSDDMGLTFRFDGEPSCRTLNTLYNAGIDCDGLSSGLDTMQKEYK